MSSLASLFTRFFVASLMLAWPLKAREMVDTDTLKAVAMSVMEARLVANGRGG